MRGLLTIHLGQCGVQMGNAIWERLACEHGIDAGGKAFDVSTNMLDCVRPPKGDDAGVLFSETRKRYYPRSIMVDLEPTVVDEIRTGPYKQFWRKSSLIGGKEDAANNYARAYINVGRKILPMLMEEIRAYTEQCENLGGFNMVHSAAGGTGSGLTSLLVECLTEEFPKKLRFTTTVYPSRVRSHSTVDPYNTLLFMKATMDILDCSLPMDNKALTDRCVLQIATENPTFTTLNRFAATFLSSLYLSHRFTFLGCQNVDMLNLLTNIIPYPRIHHPILCTSPLYSKAKQCHEMVSIPVITRQVFTREAVAVDCNIEKHCFISAAMLYRGVVSPGEVSAALRELRRYPGARIGESFVDWCPSMFKVGISSLPLASIPTCTMAAAPTSVCMVAGNVAIRDTFKSTIEKFDMLFQRSAFVHWFVCEGLEEAELTEARDEVCCLIDEYADLVECDASAEISSEQTLEAEDGRDARPEPEPPQLMVAIRESGPVQTTPRRPILKESCANPGTPTTCNTRPILTINMSNTRPRNTRPPETPLTIHRGRLATQPLPMFEAWDQGYLHEGGFHFFNMFNQQQEEIESAPWNIAHYRAPFLPTSEAALWRE